jgi:hypothetical protein
MQNGIEGCFPQKNIPHTLRRCALSYQASSHRFLFIAEHDKCGRTILAGTGQGMDSQETLYPSWFLHNSCNTTFYLVLRAERIHDRHYLVFPGFVAKGCPIEFLPVVLPQWHESIHVSNETIVVMALEQMNHFMDNDVL